MNIGRLRPTPSPPRPAPFLPPTQVFTNLGWTDTVYYEQKLQPLLTQLLAEEARERAACASRLLSFREVGRERGGEGGVRERE